ncbi:hypothetical protein M408DRAFT_331715 [Serendipita vermifera MAFF 305830]|uniref:Uncharacterized protein n=1 Tax=Serendipita vermifera MAFF 305830 TaxID=933852 RepID=A0A0C2X5R8_SERVB|nr:hypothetical protein M408DRAFT_331715 [Serendipita vermifera MAFF 305830]
MEQSARPSSGQPQPGLGSSPAPHPEAHFSHSMTTKESKRTRECDSGRDSALASALPRFDLGGEGHQPWYVPNEGTLFPVKKGSVGAPRRTEPSQDREPEPAAKHEPEDSERGSTVLWDVTEQEVERFVHGEPSSTSKGIHGTVPRLRSQRSLEEEIAGIEDDEARRLTGIAYLS